MEKIKSEHNINFKNKKESKRNNELNTINKKNYIEIQSLSSDANSFINVSISNYNDNLSKINK